MESIKYIEMHIDRILMVYISKIYIKPSHFTKVTKAKK